MLKIAVKETALAQMGSGNAGWPWGVSTMMNMGLAGKKFLLEAVQKHR